MFCNTMDVKKSQRVPPFTFFGTVTLFKNLIKKIFLGKFFHVSKGSPFNFLDFLQPAGVSQSPKCPPFKFWALDMAPTLADLGLLAYTKRRYFLFILKLVQYPTLFQEFSAQWDRFNNLMLVWNSGFSAYIHHLIFSTSFEFLHYIRTILRFSKAEKNQAEDRKQAN